MNVVMIVGLAFLALLLTAVILAIADNASSIVQDSEEN